MSINANNLKCQTCKHSFDQHVINSELAVTNPFDDYQGLKSVLNSFKCEVCGCTTWADKDRDGTQEIYLASNLHSALMGRIVWGARPGKGSVKFVNGYSKVHDVVKCQGRRCVIHAPTAHDLILWPAIMDGRKNFFMVWRLCVHFVVHPDLDALWFMEEEQDIFGIGVHDCDGCCDI